MPDARVSNTITGRDAFLRLLSERRFSDIFRAEQAGVRALLTHPIDEDAARFYQRFGFEASPVREQQLLLLLKDARRLLSGRTTPASAHGGPSRAGSRKL